MRALWRLRVAHRTGKAPTPEPVMSPSRRSVHAENSGLKASAAQMDYFKITLKERTLHRVKRHLWLPLKDLNQSKSQGFVQLQWKKSEIELVLTERVFVQGHLWL